MSGRQVSGNKVVHLSRLYPVPTLGNQRAMFMAGVVQMSKAESHGQGDMSASNWHQNNFSGASIERESDHAADKVGLRKNHLLRRFPTEVQDRLLPDLEAALLSSGKVLYEPGQPLRHVWFPTDSVVTLACVTESGSTAQVEMIGKEGLVSIAAILGGEITNFQALVCNAGHAYSLPASRLRREFDNNREVRAILLRYALSKITAIAQTAFCNRHHSIFQQLCRWLLESLDRLPDSQLVITQEMIANMLGVRVASVSEVASKLQRLGVIEYHRGHITVLDRSRLGQLTCRCYSLVKNEADRQESPHQTRALTG